MPIYTMRCTEHGIYDDVFSSMDDRHTKACPECGEYLLIVPTPVAITGYTSSKPLEIGQIGKRFETNEEFRQYQRDNPDAKILSATERRDHYDSVRNKVEATAKRQGFRSREHKTAVAKENKKRGVNVLGQPFKKPATSSP
jgi:putative FmdB family regulatory protein